MRLLNIAFRVQVLMLGTLLALVLGKLCISKLLGFGRNGRWCGVVSASSFLDALCMLVIAVLIQLAHLIVAMDAI